jgi:hypothetical protein
LVAASANTANALVQRDGSGNFTAGTITAALTGTATNASQVSLGVVVGRTIYDTFVATAAQTTFTTSTTYTANKIMVFCNGVEMVGGGADVTIANGTTIVFVSGLASGTRVEAVYTV